MQSAIVCRVGSSNPEIIDVPDISPSTSFSADEVLCRTLQLGICGTDREILHSATPWAPAGDAYLVLGHECLARVESIGPTVTSLKVGDLVVPAVRRSLPKETRRLDYLPIGGFTERGIFYEHGFSMPMWLDRPEHLYPVPEAASDIAVFTEPLAVA
ncbi:MAG: alcohol dehydrogenase catalytic domain-containing protein, partial [Pirellulales bacterium]